MEKKKSIKKVKRYRKNCKDYIEVNMGFKKVKVCAIGLNCDKICNSFEEKEEK